MLRDFQGGDVYEPLDEMQRHMYQSFASRHELRDTFMDCVQCAFWISIGDLRYIDTESITEIVD
jgi:hypothetical protein